MKKFLFLGISTVLLTASGCATESYVQQQIDPLSKRVGALEATVSAMENKLDHMPVAAGGLSPADRALLEDAKKNADMAATSAKEAAASANEAKMEAQKGQKLLELEQKK